MVDRQLVERNMSHLYREGTWQYNMLAACKSRYAVTPRRLEAIVFYIQNHDGSHSQLTRHGGCPVVRVSACMPMLFLSINIPFIVCLLIIRMM